MTENKQTERPNLLRKKKQTKELVEKLKNAKTIAFINLKNLPDRIFQRTRKMLRDTTKFMVYRKAVIQHAIDELKLPAELKKSAEVPTAVVITEKNPYSLYQFFANNKGKVAAKAGQIAPFDIIVPEGETNLPPGPALSELKAAKINARIQGGKIVIAKDSIVAKKGEKISPLVAKALQKLDIYPFEVGLNLSIAYDGKYLYKPEVLDITEEQLKQDILSSITQATNISINAQFPSSASIDALLKQAMLQAKNVGINGKLITSTSIEDVLVVTLKEGIALDNKVNKR